MDGTCLRSGMVKDKRECEGMIFEGQHSSDFSWPQRNYTCRFCKREFNSAQALGGHMNVHRRDRARLRQQPSWVFECPNAKSNSNPNPSFSSSTSLSSRPAKFLPCSYTHHSFLSPPLTSFSSTSCQEKKSIVESRQRNPFSSQSEDSTKKKNMRAVVDVGELKKGFSQKHEPNCIQKGEVISLDLEMGCKDPTEVLDLELRLGHF